MKILIATGIFPPDIGGPATMLAALAESLSKKGVEIKVLTYIDKKNRPEIFLPKRNYEINLVNREGIAIFKYLEYFFKMFRLAWWSDAVYVTDVYSVGYFAYLIKKIIRKKYVVRFAGDSAWETAVNKGWTQDYIVDFQKKVYDDKIEKLKKRREKILVNADQIIAVSNFIGGVAQEIGVNKNNIKVIYNSIDFIKESDINGVKVKKIKQVYGIKSKIIITICRLTPWKGVDGIIKIMPLLQEKIGNIKLLILGDGPELGKLKKLTESQGVDDSVYFLGRIKNNEVINYLKSADLFILNTNYEALSHTLLEAMKAEVPIITTNIGGNPEVITDGQEGILVGYNNIDELLNKSIKILTDKSLSHTLVINAKIKLKKFNWENTVNETMEVFQKLCQK